MGRSGRAAEKGAKRNLTCREWVGDERVAVAELVARPRAQSMGTVPADAVGTWVLKGPELPLDQGERPLPQASCFRGPQSSPPLTWPGPVG